MQQIPKSGFYNTNKFARIALQAYEEVMGKNGLNAILNLAGLGNLIDNYPPDNLERQFDFADYTAIHIGLEELYGPRGGRGLALRAGRATFSDVLKDYGALAGVSDLTFKVLPLQTKLRIGLPAAAKIFSQVSDQLTTVDETDDAFIWTIHRCPTCWSRKGADKPVCYITTGLLQAMLTWVSGGMEFRVNESKCCAVGDSVCEFVIQKEPLS
jgi:predicted hydrocarbon binding protein